MDVFYVGTLKGVGRIYQFTAIDTYSSFAWAKLYTDNSALSACDFMMHIIDNSLEIPDGKRTNGNLPVRLFMADWFLKV